MIDYAVDADGIATIAWNMRDRSMNVMNDASLTAFAEKARAAIADAAVKGVIVTSAKPEFVAGADLTMIGQSLPTGQMLQRFSQVQKLFREIETGPKPFVAAINGTALGGGYEICLACHYRVAADNPKALIGLPEVTVGLLPGAGGTQRLSRMIGIKAALPLLLEGRRLKPAQALAQGLVDRLVPPDRLLAEAKSWLLADGPKATVKPWDKKGFRLPDPVQSPKGYETFIGANAMLKEKTFGNYPAALNILSAVYEGCQLDIDTALKVESRYFVACLRSSAARNMIRTLFLSMNDANKLARRPEGVAKADYRRVGVLGAGLMGAGIAHVSALAGLDVVLLDTTLDKAEQGKAQSQKLLDKLVEGKRLSSAERDAALGRIRPTADFADLKGAEIVIEAVFEDRAIKAEVIKKAEAVLGAETIFGSNTSTLPITGLAQASQRPGQFIGLHFFSPVDRMKLVEIIRAKKTTDACLARAMDYVKRIGKTPIVVNDARGFYTSRVVGAYLNEGMAMLREGVKPALIENAARLAGMPVGPLALADEVQLELLARIARQTKEDLGARYAEPPGAAVLALMVDILKRTGRKAGKGFYDYPPDGSGRRLWPGLAEHFPVAAQQPVVEEVKHRLLYIQSLETARCMAEGVLVHVEDADVGSILGFGFPPYLGGTLSHIDTVGVGAFLARCKRLAKAYGPRFLPPKLLRDMAKANKSFYPEAKAA
jgi:3-hydroxyacyl-CoA dehydrogenase/enoyl-CoA hydratase/3-hydroxybutyryl-CoA epimerase